MNRLNSMHHGNYGSVVNIFPGLLVLLAFLLFTSKSLYSYPILILALLGFYYCITKTKHLLQLKEIQVFGLLFLCLWLPMLISLVDAVNLKHSLNTTAPYLRYFFMGVCLIYSAKNPLFLKFVSIGVFSLLAFWCIDAITQVLIGINFFGYPYEARHITGMFYPKNTIAHICAGLSPLFFYIVHTNYQKHRALVFLLVPLFAVVLLSGRRAAWLMLAVSCSAYVAHMFLLHNKRSFSLKHLSLLTLLVTMVLLSIISTHEATQRRVKTTLGIFSTNYETVNQATAKRLPLWETSVRIAGENWVNGIGPRGYRYAYSSYADDNDERKHTGQTHPHQMLLEIMCETGALGVLGLFVFYFVLIKSLIAGGYSAKQFPWLLAVLVVAFPLNTHMAFYGSYWSSFFWLLTALYMAARSADRSPPPG